MRPRRGEVWLADLDPVKGHEQGGLRPIVVLSIDEFNAGPGSLVIVIPLTSRDRGIPAHVAIEPPEGGLAKTSYALTEAVRSITKQRLVRRWGSLSPQTIVSIEEWVRTLLGL